MKASDTKMCVADAALTPETASAANYDNAAGQITPFGILATNEFEIIQIAAMWSRSGAL